MQLLSSLVFGAVAAITELEALAREKQTPVWIGCFLILPSCSALHNALLVPQRFKATFLDAHIMRRPFTLQHIVFSAHACCVIIRLKIPSFQLFLFSLSCLFAEIQRTCHAEVEIKQLCHPGDVFASAD